MSGKPHISAITVYTRMTPDETLLAIELEYLNSDGKLLKILDTADRTVDLSNATKYV